jgi:hypothetical protein
VTFALIAGLFVTVAAFVILLDRKDKRAHEERQADRLERAALLQRIQAPELAVVRHDVDQVSEAPQPPTDDEGYWREAEERQQAIAKLEQLENAHLFGRG